METEKMQQGETSSNIIGRTPVKINSTIFLPDDIIQEILSRLPPKSLCRFRSVHKQWFSLIPRPKLMLFKPNFLFYSIDYESIGGFVNFEPPIKVPVPYTTVRADIFGSCNGLLCIGFLFLIDGGRVETRGFQFVISNPLLKIHKIVTDLDYPCSINANTPVGFGHDSVADDYKLVSVDLHRQLVNVYSLKANLSRSFHVQSPVINYLGDCRRTGFFFNGSIYWLSDKKSAKPPMLAWFDLNDEKFEMVEVPLDRDRSLKWGSELIVVRGCLCIFTLDSKWLYLKLLMMKVDKSNVISWSVGANLEHPYGLHYGLQERPICITTDGGILMRVKNKISEEQKREERILCSSTTTKYKLVINNPQQGTVKDIPAHGFNVWYAGITYLETLVSPL